MSIECWSDASCSRVINLSVIAYKIGDLDIMIESFREEDDSIKPNSTEFEELGILRCIEYCEKYYPYQQIIIYNDNTDACNFFYDNVKIVKIDGHPKTIVDRIDVIFSEVDKAAHNEMRRLSLSDPVYKQKSREIFENDQKSYITSLNSIKCYAWVTYINDTFCIGYKIDAYPNVVEKLENCSEMIDAINICLNKIVSSYPYSKEIYINQLVNYIYPNTKIIYSMSYKEQHRLLTDISNMFSIKGSSILSFNGLYLDKNLNFSTNKNDALTFNVKNKKLTLSIVSGNGYKILREYFNIIDSKRIGFKKTDDGYLKAKFGMFLKVKNNRLILGHNKDNTCIHESNFE